MALPTEADLIKMDYAYQGQPFVQVPAKSSINLNLMDYAYQGQPFVRNAMVVTVTTSIKKFLGFIPTDIKKIYGETTTSWKKLIDIVNT